MKIEKLRKQHKMTQAELAQACNTTQQQIAKIEKGLVDPKLSTLRKVAMCFESEIGDLFWTKKEFIKTVNQVIAEKKVNVHRDGFTYLSSLCQQEGLSTFHPYWEMVVLKNNKIEFQGGKQ